MNDDMPNPLLVAGSLVLGGLVSAVWWAYARIRNLMDGVQ